MTKRFWSGTLAVAVLLMSAAGESARAAVLFFPNGNNISATNQQRVRDAFQQADDAVTNFLYFLRGNASMAIQGRNNHFNNNLGHFFNRNSPTNPLFGTPEYPTYRASTEILHSMVRQRPVGFGVGNANNFQFVDGTPYEGDVVVGTRVYSTPEDRLYPIPSRTYAFGPFGFPGPGPTGAGVTGVNTSPINNNNQNTTAQPKRAIAGAAANTQLEAEEFTSTQWARSPLVYPPFAPGIDGAQTVLRVVVGDTVALDATRYSQLVVLMEAVQHALRDVLFTVSSNLEGNRRRILNDQPTPLVFLPTFYNPLGRDLSLRGLTRASNSPATTARATADVMGFERYGLSTSGSPQYLLRNTPNTPTPLNWYEDTGDTDGDGFLDPGETNFFFRDKFKALAQDTTPLLASEQTSALLFLGQTAFDETDPVNNGIFDQTVSNGQVQRGDRLWETILGAVMHMVGLGQREIGGIGVAPTHNRDQINGVATNFNQGNPNIDNFFSFFGSSNQFFPQQFNIQSLINIIKSVLPVTQGGSANAVRGPPPGKQVISAQGFHRPFSNNIIVPFL